MASELVASHMAAVVNVSEDRSKVWVRYPSCDLVLAMAASHEWNRDLASLLTSVNNLGIYQILENRG